MIGSKIIKRMGLFGKEGFFVIKVNKKVRCHIHGKATARLLFTCEQKSRGGGGGYSPKFRIGVCRERSQTLTLSKDKENEN